MEIILATGNKNKLREFREMLSSDDVFDHSSKMNLGTALK